MATYYGGSTTTGSADSGPFRFTSTKMYDPRLQAQRTDMDVVMSKEFLDRVENEFMNKMEDRIWKRIETLKALQDNYDNILGPVRTKNKRPLTASEAATRQRESKMGLMRAAMANTTYSATGEPVFTGIPDYIAKDQPVYWSYIGNPCVYSDQSVKLVVDRPQRNGYLTPTTLAALWKETNEWLKDINLDKL